MNRIQLSPPHLGAEERALLLDAYDTGWITAGSYLSRFEEELAERAGVAHAAAVASGTAALHLALMLLGVGPGDRVLTSTLTFAATANAIAYVGAEPVFIDSERESWNLDPALVADEVEASLARGERPAAVVVVHLYGQCCDVDAIRAACAPHGIPIVEDAAEALGATYKGRPPGGLGDLGIFSFNGNKIITTAGGGVLLGDDAGRIAEARRLANQARDPAPHYQHSAIGFNYRLNNLQAAIGCGQLALLEERVSARREVFRRYEEALGDLPEVTLQPEAPWGRSTRWLTCLTLDGVDREAVRKHLDAAGIEARPVWKPMHLQPVFADRRAVGGEVAADLFARGLCLPSGSNLSEADQARVVAALREALGR